MEHSATSQWRANSVSPQVGQCVHPARASRLGRSCAQVIAPIDALGRSFKATAIVSTYVGGDDGRQQPSTPSLRAASRSRLLQGDQGGRSAQALEPSRAIQLPD